MTQNNLTRIGVWFRELFHVHEVEFCYDVDAKQVFFRKVKRKLFPRKDGWRQYKYNETRSFSVSRGQFLSFAEQIKSGEQFLKSMEKQYGRAND